MELETGWHLLEQVAGNFEGTIDIGAGVGCTNVVALHRCGDHEDTMLAHRAAEPDVAGIIVAEEVGVGLDGPWIHEVGYKDRAKAGDVDGDAQLLTDLGETISSDLSEAKAVGVYGTTLQFGDGSQGC